MPFSCAFSYGFSYAGSPWTPYVAGSNRVGRLRTAITPHTHLLHSDSRARRRPGNEPAARLRVASAPHTHLLRSDSVMPVLSSVFASWVRTLVRRTRTCCAATRLCRFAVNCCAATRKLATHASGTAARTRVPHCRFEAECSRRSRGLRKSSSTRAELLASKSRITSRRLCRREAGHPC